MIENKNMDQLSKAVVFAANAHAGQFRKTSGIPFISHPIEVMKTVSRWKIREEYKLVSSVLHDTVEDTRTTIEDIEDEFGTQVANLVDELTRPQHIKTKKDKLEYLKSFKDKSLDAIIIKLADRLCNVRDFEADGNPEYSEIYALQAYPLINLYHSAIGIKRKEMDRDILYLSSMASRVVMSQKIYGNNKQQLSVMYFDVQCFSEKCDDIILGAR